jgi:hypothetical protein
MAYDDLKISTGTFPGWGTWPQSNVTIGAATQISAATNQYVYATNGTYTSSPITSTPSGTLELQGEGADVRINGVSLTGVLKNIEERLNILRPNTELETEWNQLKELGDQYRQLEAELKEKSKMWSTLKSIPKIDND